MDTQEAGYVEMFWRNKGYGFIRPDNGGQTVFVHRSNLREGTGRLVRGDRVTYRLEIRPKGPTAFDVAKIENPSLF